MRIDILLVLAVAAGIAGCDDTPAAPSPAPPTLAQFVLAPASVAAGATSEGTVILNGGALANAEVRLSSSDGVAVVPASIMVPAGAAIASFTVTTRLVAADTSATISATLGTDKRDAVLRVMAPIAKPPTLQGLAVDSAMLKGGQNTRGTIQLTGPALSPMTLTVRSSNPAALVPPSVTVFTGAASVTFTITTRPVTLDTIFDITASLADQSRSAQIRLMP